MDTEGKTRSSKMELLAPAGSIEAFEAAVEAGADAVYLGAPFLNARALARHFSRAEIAAMTAYGKKHRVRVFIAMNSLLKEAEIPAALELLCFFEEIGVNGVIVQDLGLGFLIRRFFPKLRLHASTLTAAHNIPAVKEFERLGYQRVVLPRELTIEEIRGIREQTGVELEVFIHGAMCFSYSGLCLFSSFQGGKSGLRGHCVQPCRRKYTWKDGRAEGGYLFSMGDLCGLGQVAALREMGVNSLKIEGRMKNAEYVRRVVSAYRLVLDAPEGTNGALEEARGMLAATMSRRETTGYFTGSQPAGLIRPDHSGNIGVFAGTVVSAKNGEIAFTLRENISLGDRLRIHHEEDGERTAFTVKGLRINGQNARQAATGAKVILTAPERARPGDRLYLVDTREARLQERKRSAIQPGSFTRQAKIDYSGKAGMLAAKVRQLTGKGGRDRLHNDSVQARSSLARPGRAVRVGAGADRVTLPLWLRIGEEDDPHVARHLRPARVVVPLTPISWERLEKRARPVRLDPGRTVWALPPIIDQERVSFYAATISALIGRGARSFQIGHIGQLPFFRTEREGGLLKMPSGKPPHLSLYGDATLNILNSLSLHVALREGLASTQFSTETDRDNLRQVLNIVGRQVCGLTVYGALALFTARLQAEHFRYGKTFVSPREEPFVLRRFAGLSVAVPEQAFSLLPALNELTAMGLAWGVLDISYLNLSLRELDDLFHPAQSRSRRLPTFNYYGKLS